MFKPEVTGADQRHPLFFSVLADALAASEPYAAWDKEFIENKLSRLGVAPGKTFDFEALSEAAQQTILDGQESAFDEVIAKGEASFGTNINGWLLNPANHGDWQGRLDVQSLRDLHRWNVSDQQQQYLRHNLLRS